MKTSVTGITRIFHPLTQSLCLLIVVWLLAGLAPAQAQTTTTRFAVIGDFGSNNSDERDVADLVKSWNPDFIITVGDNNYPDGAASTIDPNIGQFYHQFIYPYSGAYGASADINRFFPSLGNHDWIASGAQPYLNYFTLPGNERYYDFVWGPVHLFAIDSDSHEPDGITSNSQQALWLQTRLAASPEPWKIVYFHHPPYSSRTSWHNLQWPFQQWGASAVVAGHAHVYERVMRNGFPYITDGIGGESGGSFNTPIEGSVVRWGKDFGALLVTASADSINFQFITRTNLLIDTFTMGAGATPSPTPTPSPSPTPSALPSPPGNLAATVASSSQINLTWKDNSNNETGFKVERCQGTGCSSFSQIAQLGAGVTSYSNSGLSANTTYVYRVRAFNGTGNSGYSSNATATTLQSGLPAAPSNLTAAAASSSRINLTWKDNSSNETGFKVERCTGSSCTNFSEIGQVAAAVTTYASRNLSSTTTYRYRVRAFNGASNSAYSNTASATTQ